MKNKKPSYTKLSITKIRRTITRSPLQFIAVILITLIATTLFSGFYSSYLSFNEQINEIYTTGNFCDIQTTIVASDDASKDKSYVVEAVGDKGKVESRFYEFGKINGYTTYVAISDTYPTINAPFDTDTSTKADDSFFVIDHSFTSQRQYGGKSKWYDSETKQYKPVSFSVPVATMLSDIFDVKTDKSPFEKCLKSGVDNPINNNYLSVKMTPTGKMHHPERVVSTDSVFQVSIVSRAYIKKELINTLNTCFDPDKLDQSIEIEKKCYDLLKNPESLFINKYFKDNQYLTKLNNSNNTNAVLKSISSNLQSKDREIISNIGRSDMSCNEIISNDLKQTKALSIVFPIVFYVVAILVVITTLSQIVLKERNDIGTLKAIGVSTKQILIYYIALLLSVSLIGVIIGLIIGPLILPPLMQIKFDNLYYLPKMKYMFPWLIALIIIVSIVVAVTLVTYIIARKEAKELPSISMRPKAVKSFKSSKIVNKKKKSVNKLSIKMAFRNIRCSMAKSVMVIAGVAGSVALLCGGFGVDDSLEKGVSNDIDKYLRCDAMITFSGETKDTKSHIEKMYYTDKTITAFQQYCYLPTSVSQVGASNGVSTYAYGVDTYLNQVFKFFNFGKEKVYSNHVIVSKKIANECECKVGDWINFRVLGKSYIGKVGYIVDSFYLQGIFYDALNSEYPTLGSYGNCAYVRINHDLNKDDEILNEIKSLEGVSTFMTYESLSQNFDKILSSLKTITLIVKIFAILLALVVLYNFAILNYKERIRSVATMKVLGFNRKEISMSLVIEIMTLTIIGTIIGLGLGYPFVIFFLNMNKTSILEFIFYISPLSFIYSLLIAFVTSLLLNIFLAYRSKKISMVESLKSVE